MHFNSLIHLLDYFEDEKTCVEYYTQVRWQGVVTCPHCATQKPYVLKVGYKCRHKDCRKKFNAKTGTIFENTKLPLRIWFAALYLFTTSKKGVSSLQLARQLKITQKTAWFVLHRMREMFTAETDQKLNPDVPVEIDEAYVGGRQRNMHFKKKRSRHNPDYTNEGKLFKDKKVVLGIIQRGGPVILKFITNNIHESILNHIKNHVLAGSTIYTDEHGYYHQLGRWYDHQTINHSDKQYVDGDIYTNTIESFWAIVKRGIIGIYHQVSEKHLTRYLHEFATRFNTRKLTNDVRFGILLNQSYRRLTYNNLIAAA